MGCLEQSYVVKFSRTIILNELHKSYEWEKTSVKYRQYTARTDQMHFR